MFAIKRESNYQDFLKLLALLAMIADHIGLFIFQDLLWVRIIGRFALPIFAFYAGYNFRGKIRHLIWIYGLLILVAWKYVYGLWITNILLTISIGQFYLYYFGKDIFSNENKFLLHFFMMLFLTPITYHIMDYGTITVAFMQIGYIVANNGKDQGHMILATIALTIFNFFLFQIDELELFVGMNFFVCLSSILLYFTPHKQRLRLGLSVISKYLLHIYTLSMIILIFWPLLLSM